MAVAGGHLIRQEELGAAIRLPNAAEGGGAWPTGLTPATSPLSPDGTHLLLTRLGRSAHLYTIPADWP